MNKVLIQKLTTLSQNSFRLILKEKRSQNFTLVAVVFYFKLFFEEPVMIDASFGMVTTVRFVEVIDIPVYIDETATITLCQQVMLQILMYVLVDYSSLFFHIVAVLLTLLMHLLIKGKAFFHEQCMFPKMLTCKLVLLRCEIPET